MISRQMSTTVELTEPQLGYLARFGSGRVRQLVRLHERHPGLARDVLAANIQRGAYPRWSRRAGRTAR
jgi:hypothetical protein